MKAVTLGIEVLVRLGQDVAYETASVAISRVISQLAGNTLSCLERKVKPHILMCEVAASDGSVDETPFP
jgi:hypothetical protein